MVTLALASPRSRGRQSADRLHGLGPQWRCGRTRNTEITTCSSRSSMMPTATWDEGLISRDAVL